MLKPSCGRLPAGIPSDIGPRFCFALAGSDKLNSDEQTALVLEAIWRVYAGRMDRFRPAKDIPSQVEKFLLARPSLPARQAALLAMLKSVIPDEAVGRADATGSG